MVSASTGGTPMRVGREKEVCAKTKLSRSSVRRRERDPVDPFPAHFPIGPSAVAWDLDAVDQWLERRATTTKAAS